VNATIRLNLFLGNSLGAPVYWVQQVLSLVRIGASLYNATSVEYAVFPFPSIYPTLSVTEEWTAPLAVHVRLPALLNFSVYLNTTTGPMDAVVAFVFGQGISTVSLAAPGAEYILGELVRQAGDLDSAIQHFSKATKLDANFADAYLGLGTTLVTEKNYAAAIPPLEMAVKLQPENPAGHYSLATAYARTGRKEDAEREFALHQQMAERAGGQGAQSPQ